MSNIVWNSERGWHDGPEIDNAEVARRLGIPERNCTMKTPTEITFNVTREELAEVT